MVSKQEVEVATVAPASASATATLASSMHGSSAMESSLVPLPPILTLEEFVLQQGNTEKLIKNYGQLQFQQKQEQQYQQQGQQEEEEEQYSTWQQGKSALTALQEYNKLNQGNASYGMSKPPQRFGYGSSNSTILPSVTLEGSGTDKGTKFFARNVDIKPVQQQIQQQPLQRIRQQPQQTQPQQHTLRHVYPLNKPIIVPLQQEEFIPYKYNSQDNTHSLYNNGTTATTSGNNNYNSSSSSSSVKQWHQYQFQTTPTSTSYKLGKSTSMQEQEQQQVNELVPYSNCVTLEKEAGKEGFQQMQQQFILVPEHKCTHKHTAVLRHSSTTNNKNSSHFFDQVHNGHWTAQEHEAFLKGVKQVGHNWKVIARDFVKTRSRTQVASHAQTHFLKLQRKKKKRQPSTAA